MQNINKQNEAMVIVRKPQKGKDPKKKMNKMKNKDKNQK